MMTCWIVSALLAAQGAPVPGAAEQATAEKELRRIWKADYALLPAQRGAVAKKFLARGKDVVELPFKYVIFREARELAAQAGDVSTSFDAINAMTAAFAAEGVSEKAAVLARIEAQAKSPEEFRATTAIALDLVDEAISLGRLDTATAVLSRVSARAVKDDPRGLVKRLQRALEIRSAMDAARAAGSKDWATPWMYLNPNDLNRGMMNQRENAWSSSPKAPDKPFKWVRTVQLTKAAHLLYVEVSAEAAGSWTLVVSANGEELIRKTIKGARWQSLEIDLGTYSNRTVTLEVVNGPVDGAPSNKACWSNLQILPPPAGDVIPSNNDPRRIPFPDSAQQVRAEKLLQEMPELQLKTAAGPSEKLEWAGKLIEEARKNGDMSLQYVLLKKAREAGVQTGDLRTISQAVDAMAGAFGVDLFEEKLAFFWKVDSSRKTPEGVDRYLAIAREALSARNGEAALHALSRAERAARTLKYAAGLTQARELTAAALQIVSQGWAAQWIWQDTSPGQIVQDTFNRRTHVWQTQPATSDRPFKWKRRVRLPAGQPSFLHLDVSSRQPVDKYGHEWSVQVVVNGKESLNKVVKGTEWRHYVVDLSAHAGREVELELWNKSDDAHGHGQFGYWDRVYLSYDP